MLICKVDVNKVASLTDSRNTIIKTFENRRETNCRYYAVSNDVNINIILL